MGNDVYGLVWLSRLAASALAGNNQSGDGGCLNLIERTAAPGGGYEEPCGW